MTTRHERMMIAATLHYYTRGVELYGSMPSGKENTILEFTKLTVKEKNIGMSREPFAILDHTQATELMDSLWRAGIRPTEVGTHGELSATKYHLEDMRLLAGVKQNGVGVR